MDTEIRVNPTLDKTGNVVKGEGKANVASLFFDADGDDMQYNLVVGGTGTPVDDGAQGIQPGKLVYRSANDDQILTLNHETGAVTYQTTNATSHGFADNRIAQGTIGNEDDGQGNLFMVPVQATDGKADGDEGDTGESDTFDDVMIEVRVNVAPTAIELDGSDIQDDAAGAPTASGISFDETAGYEGTHSAVLDVQDLNLNTDDFGSHTVTVTREKPDGSYVADSRFELDRVDGTDMSLWTLSIKDGAEFDYEHADNPSGVITLKVTATDKGGKSTVGYISVALTDVSTNDPQDNQPTSSGSAGNGGVMTTGGGAR